MWSRTTKQSGSALWRGDFWVEVWEGTNYAKIGGRHPARVYSKGNSLFGRCIWITENNRVAGMEWVRERMVWDEIKEAGRWQRLWGIVGYSEVFGLYFECKRKPLDDFKQGTNMIWFMFFGCYAANGLWEITGETRTPSRKTMVVVPVRVWCYGGKSEQLVRLFFEFL